MEIFVNGQAHQIESPLSLIQLIDHLGLEPRKMAIERNLEIVPKSAWEQTALNAGDRIEIVQFVGGG